MSLQITKGTTKVTGNVTTTISGNLPSPSGTQTLVRAHISGGSNGSALYTVTAGKTFYCLGLSFDSSTDSSQSLTIDGTATQFPVIVGTVKTKIVFTGGILFSLGATKSITVATNAASSIYCSMWGYEA